MLDLYNFPLPKLKEGDYGRDEIKKEYLRRECQIAVKNLKKNKFSASYCDTLKEGASLVLSLIPDNSIVACGDSHTIFALKLDDELEKKNCPVIPHTCAVNSYVFENKLSGYKIIGNKQETREILMQYLTANVFMLGANAITLDGQILNIDGAGNRIAGSIYGADRIIIIAGANKVVKDLAAGLDRIRLVAAKMNNLKYGNNLSCNILGQCEDCSSPQRNCNITSIIHKRPEGSDFHIILIGEELGF